MINISYLKTKINIAPSIEIILMMGLCFQFIFKASYLYTYSNFKL
ncbi:hypothetical protein HMPREF3200_00942 [Anaerococcus tetradius]|uniref:Uncharacterized protein n=1 Tax=Anaerococcus tetradius TaxID=33036 RepID=A0A133KEY8_9FIRM|nr:hypothetical protein HMPREF3200_00942 [Anaerococcus tetradius]